MSDTIQSVTKTFQQLYAQKAESEFAKWLTALVQPLWRDSLLLEEAADVRRIQMKDTARATGVDAPVYLLESRVDDAGGHMQQIVVGLARYISTKTRYDGDKIRDGSLVDDVYSEQPRSLADVLIKDLYHGCVQKFQKQIGLKHYGDDPYYVIVELSPPTFYVECTDDHLDAFCYLEAGCFVLPRSEQVKD